MTLLSPNEILNELRDIGFDGSSGYRVEFLVNELAKWIEPSPVPFLGRPRAPGWTRLAEEVVAEHPFCSACGGTELLQVHHKVPFHERPDLELVKSNCMVLCMAPLRLCHFGLGHAWNWQDVNPDAEEMAAKLLARKNARKAIDMLSTNAIIHS